MNIIWIVIILHDILHSLYWITWYYCLNLIILSCLYLLTILIIWNLFELLTFLHWIILNLAIIIMNSWKLIIWFSYLRNSGYLISLIFLSLTIVQSWLYLRIWSSLYLAIIVIHGSLVGLHFILAICHYLFS